MLKFRFSSLIFITSVVLFFSCSTSGSVPAEEAAAAWYNLGNAYTELGRHSEAVKAYTKARQLYPGLLGAGFNLARVHIILKQYDEGIKQLELLLENDPENRNVLETLAWVYHLQGDNEATMEIYNRVLADFNGSRNSLYNSALILSDAEDFLESLSRFKLLYELYPDEDSVVFRIAFLEASLGNPENSLIWLEKRLSTSPDDIDALELSGDMYVQIKDYSEALASYRSILSMLDSEDTQTTPQQQLEVPSDVEGRVSFKIGELLLLYMEDTDSGIEAIQHSLDAGWNDQEDFNRILEYREAEWYDTVSKMLVKEEASADTEKSVPAE